RAGNVAMEQEGFHRTTNTVAVGFCVDGDVVGFIVVGRGVDVYVAVTVQMLEQGDFGFGRQASDKPFASTGNNHVDVVGKRNELTHQAPISGTGNLYGVMWQPGIAQRGANDFTQSLVGMKGFA